MKSPIAYKLSDIPGLEVLSCVNTFSFSDHLHTGHVLWVNSSGGECFQVKGQSDILQPGCISIIEPGIVHNNGPFPKSNRHLCSIYLGDDFFCHLKKLFTGYDDRSFNLPTTVIKDKRHWLQVIRLHELIFEGAEQIVVEEQLLPLLRGLADNAFTSCMDLAGTGNSGRTLDRIVQYMRTRLQDSLSLEMLADVAGCTSFHLMRLFKKQLGMSPHTYLVHLRLEQARELLGQGHSIADAAFSSGFSDQSHLTRRFKQRYGLTPGAYLRQKAR